MPLGSSCPPRPPGGCSSPDALPAPCAPLSPGLGSHWSSCYSWLALLGVKRTFLAMFEGEESPSPFLSIPFILKFRHLFNNLFILEIASNVILRLFYFFFLKCFHKDVLLPVCLVHGLYFLLHVKNAAPPSPTHDSWVCPPRYNFEFNKKDAAPSYEERRMCSQHDPVSPIASDAIWSGSRGYGMRGEEGGEPVTHLRKVEPTSTWGASENNSGIHYALAEPRVINKMSGLSKEWQG